MSASPVSRYLLSPASMLTGPGCRHTASSEIARLGRRAFVLGGSNGLAAAASVLEQLEDAMAHVCIQTFHGECTETTIATAAQAAADCDLLIGVGGGKAIDTAKAAAVEASIPCVTIPTSPATCAAYTPLSILHNKRGAYIESRRLPRPIAIMILDPELMLGAPTRLLSAGCVDALARSWDTLLAARCGVPSSMAALSISVCDHLWNETLRPLAGKAVEDNRQGYVTTAFATVIEACITGAGLAGQLGARFFGRSFSHAVGYALAGVVDNAVVLHGEAVGLGILVQCAIDPETPVSLEDMTEYFEALSAPTRFADLGFNGLPGEEGRNLASAIHSLLDLEAAVPFPVLVDNLYHTLLAVEQIVSG